MGQLHCAFRRPQDLWLCYAILPPELGFDQSLVLSAHHPAVWHGILRGSSHPPFGSSIFLRCNSRHHLLDCWRPVSAPRPCHYFQLYLYHRWLQYARIRLPGHSEVCWDVSSNGSICQQLGCNECVPSIEYLW